VSARLRTLAIVAGLLVLLGFGFFFLRGPQPHISIKAETLWTIGPIEITNTLFTSWFVVLFLIAFAFFATRKLSIIPSGLQNVAEAAIEGLYGLVTGIAGEKNGRRFFPVIATFFLYIVISNWFALFPFFSAIGKVEVVGVEEDHFFHEAIVFEGDGPFFITSGAEELEFHEVDESSCEDLTGDEKTHCIEELRAEEIAHVREEEGVDADSTVGIIAPYFRSVNTDLMSPLSLAIISAIFVEFWGISTLGFFSYGSRFFNVKRLASGNVFMGLIDFFVGILEFIAEIARLISFSFRLFGNMLAGEILLLMMTFLIPLLLVLPFYGLELFVGAIQAFVFAVLTLVFGALAVTSHGDEEHGGEGHATGAGDAAPAHHGDS
jgi:F-type H+-transporting ATPase subunit a